MERFKQVLEDCGLNEMQVYGPRFSWLSGFGLNMTRERLDKGVATKGWFTK